MKLTSPTIAALAVAALGPTACTIEVSPALPSAGDNASAPAGDTSTAEVNRTSETTKEETPGIPSGLPTLTGADGSAIPYQMALSTADAPSSDLATEVVAELTPILSRLTAPWTATGMQPSSRTPQTARTHTGR